MLVRTRHASYAIAATVALTCGPIDAQMPKVQTAGAAPADPSATNPVPPAAPVNQAIVVTGSRIARRDYVADSPIVTVGASAVASTGAVTLENALNQLPQATPSAGAASNFTSRGGQANIDLRGIGQQRTLVLVNDKRMQPSSSDGSVDLNVIPTALIENVEVITGGASAIYGSDAIAGVVNIKLRKRFSGLELDAQSGVSGEGDGATRDVTGIVGTDIGDHRGNVYTAFDYSTRDREEFTSRDYLTGQALSTNLQSSLVQVSAANLPSQAAVNSVFARYGVAAGRVSRSSQFSVNGDDSLFTQAGAINYKGSTNSPYRLYNGSIYSVPGDAFWAQTPLTRYSGALHADYRFSDAVHFYADGLFTHYSVRTQGNPAVAGGGNTTPIVVPVTNPFIPADLATILASRPNPAAPFTIAQAEYGIGLRGERDTYNLYQITAGFDGKLPLGDLSYNAFGSIGRTHNSQDEFNYASAKAINQLLAAPDGGQSLCDGGFNPFGIHAISASCLGFLNRRATNETTLKQQIGELDIQGSLFKLPAGDLRFSVGGDYRNNSYNFVPDPLIASGELINYSPIFASGGSEHAYEGYGELLVPVVRDLPLIRQLDLDLGYRYSSYNTVGGVSTYKADVNWKVTRAIAVRGGYARATRAPSVGELYAAQTQGGQPLGAAGLLGQGDPCDVKGAYRAAGAANAAQVRSLCLAQGVPASLIDSFSNLNSRTPFTQQGNTALQPESSNTYSVGLVLTPHFSSAALSHLTASIDYYSISLDHAIGLVTNNVATAQCFNSTVNPDFSQANTFCSLIQRNAGNGQINNINNPELNLGGYSTSGIDFELDWTVPLDAFGLSSRLGSLSLSSVGNYLRTFKIRTLPDGPKLDYAGTIGNMQVDLFADAHPRWKATTSLAWQLPGLRTSVRWRYLDAMRNANNVGNTGTAHGVPAVSYFDLDLFVPIRSRFELRGGIVNLANKKPPVLNDNIIGNVATDPYTYDLIGRRFYIAVKAKL